LDTLVALARRVGVHLFLPQNLVLRSVNHKGEASTRTVSTRRSRPLRVAALRITANIPNAFLSSKFTFRSYNHLIQAFSGVGGFRLLDTHGVDPEQFGLLDRGPPSVDGEALAFLQIGRNGVAAERAEMGLEV
jgi:hypothetical protein